ncbi:MAG: hypothetical protein AB7P49_02055 [Bdellovibrionales bacterium]
MRTIVLNQNEKIVLSMHIVCVWITELMSVMWLVLSGDDHAFTKGFLVIWITVLLIGTKDAIDAFLATKSYRAAEHIWASMECIGSGALCMSLGSTFTDGFGAPAAFSMVLGVYSFGIGHEWYPSCRRALEHTYIGQMEEPQQLEVYS